MRRILGLFLLFLFVGCASLCEQKKYDLNSKIEKVTTDRFLDSNKRTLIVFNITFKEELSEEITLDKLYYKNKVASIQEKDKKRYFAKLKYHPMPPITMQRDGKKEYGNPNPKLTPPPIALEENQALITYTVDSETKYYIIKNVVESSPHVAPGAITE